MPAGAIARRLPIPGARGALTQTAAGLLVAVAAAGLTAYVIHRATMASVAILIVTLGALWLACTRHTLAALAVEMLYLGLLDGYLKLSISSNLVTFVRDALLYAIVIGLLVRAIVRRQRLPLPPLSLWVIAFVILVLVEIANPRGGSLVHSLAGVRQHLEFVPLFFLTYSFVRTVKALRMFVLLLAIIALANGVVGLVQLGETPQQFASWGPGYAQRVLGEGGFTGAGRSFANQETGTASTRPFGLGSDAGDGGLAGALALTGIIALASLYTRRRYLLIAVVMAAGATLAIVTSQGRGVIVSSVIIMLVFGLLAARSRTRVRSVIGLALAALVTGLVVHSVIGTTGSNGLRYQGLSPSRILQTTGTARGRSIAAIPRNLASYPFGAGLATAGPGSGSPGASQLTQTGNVDAETEFSYLTIEVGIPGMLVLTGFTVALLALGFRRCRDEPDPAARALLAAVIAPLGGILALYFTSAPTSSVPIAPYLWAVAGIISYWLVTLPAARRRAASAASPVPPPPPQLRTGVRIAGP